MIHETWPDQACALAVEFKKIYMDEWTGEPDRVRLDRLVAALESTVAHLRPTFESLL